MGQLTYAPSKVHCLKLIRTFLQIRGTDFCKMAEIHPSTLCMIEKGSILIPVDSKLYLLIQDLLLKSSIAEDQKVILLQELKDQSVNPLSKE